MKVILLEENRIADVSDGYARNHLFPKKMAVLATEVNIAKFEKVMKEREKEIAAQRQAAEEIAKKLEDKTIIVKADVGEEGKLFGTVTAQDIVLAVMEQLGIEIDKKKVNLNDHIKVVGEYSASVKLHFQVTAHLKIKVEPK